MEIADKEYIQRCRNGQTEDFRFLVNRYQKSVFSFLSTKLCNMSDIEEAAQESFVRAFMAIRKIKKPESFHSWLLGIARRVALEQHHTQKRRRLECAIEEDIEAAQSGNTETGSLDEAIAALPESYRRLILMRYYEGQSCREIGLKLEIPIGTVTKMLSRAYALLRGELRARGDF
ncbi:MAG: RNA polymerase sigma factor [Acidobacteriota bacterium]|jgi:RNA polymerase sigma-70 factor (ECF subfamily)|nr:RNA polymerase sigma factor [Acidobacteriota bacterium]